MPCLREVARLMTEQLTLAKEKHLAIKVGSDNTKDKVATGFTTHPLTDVLARMLSSLAALQHPHHLQSIWIKHLLRFLRLKLDLYGCFVPECRE